MGIQEIVKRYVAAWRELDEEKRRRLLDQVWADDGTYTDPIQHTEGREALNRMIALYQQRRPGTQVVQTSGVDHHHNKIRFNWALLDADGSTLIAGVDFGELAEDGRLRRIVGFFGPLPRGTEKQLFSE
jgi:hypothetical protein